MNNSVVNEAFDNGFRDGRLSLRKENNELQAQNKALKERDWEECCEEVKLALRTEISALEQSRDELLDEGYASFVI